MGWFEFWYFYDCKAILQLFTSHSLMLDYLSLAYLPRDQCARSLPQAFSCTRQGARTLTLPVVSLTSFDEDRALQFFHSAEGQRDATYF